MMKIFRAKLMKFGEKYFPPEEYTIVMEPSWGLPGISLTDFMNFRVYVFFGIFVFFKIRSTDVMVLGGPVCAAVGPESAPFLLPGEAWSSGHTWL